MVFTSQDILKAKEHNSKMYSRRKKVHSTNNVAHIKGYLGELLFETYLKALGVKYEKAPEDTLEHGDQYDFLVYGNKQQHKIDVKSFYSDFYIADEYQAEKAVKNAVILVFVRILADYKEGEVVGWAKPEWDDLPQDHYFWRKYPDKKWKYIPNNKMKLFEKTFIL